MWYPLTKRAMDVVFATAGLILTAPIFLFISVLIKFDSSGPVFADTPERVGKNGEIFKMYKFRSMIKDAHTLLRTDQRFKEFYQRYKKNNFKIRTDEDPRITRVGRFIRKTSIDELPQLINIIKGDMSLVGPRAFHVDELREQQRVFPKTKKNVQAARTVKPGLTGPWQISGRSSIDFPERIKLDAEYAKRRSISYDFKTMLQTIPAVFRGEGN
ncbi:MAG: hypothetical protein A2Z42_03385 [Candidatus Woykebacteria bacterium RBG_19FT_COMBO_43_10]|uniref:Bacterial sugar transferase domain-containing protein n=1 Tax=Candidatus Woykebacteria bacterium RBG_19FT_COMBO_43_10 TaxID=1802598 RepID=A0A1G1WF66_9BACT|nr:MAG: hypothetical protein A2Z42_03385 [Candidatus Woykebacteria bacterium RBG_19FT_COMBO_43_10]